MAHGLIHFDRMNELVTRAMASGAARVSTIWWRWDLAKNCESPVERDLYSRPPRGASKWITVDRNNRHPLGLRLVTRCRKCDPCLLARAAHWRLRTLAEFQGAERTWFVTLTFRPEAQFHILEVARHKAALEGQDFESLAPADQFKALATCSGAEVTKFLKRVRKNSGARFKYLAVAEAHKSGKPHWHLLIFENEPFKPVRHSVLSSAWVLGYSNCKIADTKSATYLCKYLSKSLSARVRASTGFGK